MNKSANRWGSTHTHTHTHTVNSNKGVILATTARVCLTYTKNK